MTLNADYLEFLNLYSERESAVFRPTMLKLKNIFRIIRGFEYWRNYQGLPSTYGLPIRRTVTRLKRPESIRDKVLRKPEVYRSGLCEESLFDMTDVIAGRLIVYFLADLAIVDDVIRNSGFFELSPTHKPQAYLSSVFPPPPNLNLDTFEVLDKESGYVALHHVVKLHKNELGDLRPMWIEIQLKTLMEDAWADVEHSLGYKPDKGTTFDVKGQFKLMSRMLYAIETSLNDIPDALKKAEQTLVETDIMDNTPLNPEILPVLLAKERQLKCDLKELNGMIKILVSRGINTAGKLREALRLRRYNLIEKVYLANEFTKRKPVTFEIIANLPHLWHAKNDAEAKRLIESQIEYNEVWVRISGFYGLK